MLYLLKDRLKKQAVEDGVTMQDKLTTFGLERAIYRLSISPYKERFTLKGGIFLYALFEGKFARATMDIDLLAQHIPNSTDEMCIRDSADRIKIFYFILQNGNNFI